MTGWTEDTLRQAASWKAFKEGKGFFENGVVAESKAGESGWAGAVKSGSRLIRVKVAVKSATDLETRCSCPENQSTGALCAHAVAVGLAALSKGAAPAAAPASSAPKPAPAVALSWKIQFPSNWRDALQRGRLSASISAAETGISPADERLSAWLAREGISGRNSLSINLDGENVSSFLETIADHPAVVSGKDRAAVSIRAGERWALKDARLHEGHIRLEPDEEDSGWSEIGAAFWKHSESEIVRLGVGTVPSGLLEPLRAMSRGRTAEIPASRFLGELDAWQEWLAFPDGSWLDSLHFIPAPAVIELSLEGSLQNLEARLQVKYGDQPAVSPGLGRVEGLPRLTAGQCEIRNLAAEKQAVDRLAAAGFQMTDLASGRWILKGEESIVEFLTRSLPALRREWSVREGERFSHVRKQVSVVSPKIEILGSGEDWLSFDLSFQTNDGATIPAAEVRRLLRAGKGGGKVAGGRHLVISNDTTELLDPLFEEIDLRQEGGHYVTSSCTGLLIQEVCEKLGNAQKIKDPSCAGTFEIPLTIQADLRPYQQKGTAWLQDRVTRFGGAVLADDMGLGKTVQTIALIESLFASPSDDSGVVLVLATASLLGNWKAEFSKFAPGRVTRILHGSGRDREREKVAHGDVVITSYGTLARDLAWHLQREYRAVVVDEASLMRNPDTDHAKAIAKLKSARRVALTGTPIENGVRDLWSIFRFIQPGWLGGREEFRDRYELALSSGESAKAVMDRLRLKVSPFLLRRTKEQVAPELPTKILIDEFCDLSPDQTAVYKELLVEGKKRVDAIKDSGNKGAARMQMLTALLRLRQTCCDLALLGSERFNQMIPAKRSAKLERLLELIEEAVSGGHRILVFSQFQKQLLEIEKCIVGKNWDCLRLDGQTRNRQQLVDKFQQADGPPVFLISLKAGGYGLNLTAADVVVHFDPWWNPAAEAQATDRAHRIGQTRPVTVYRLLTRGTVEEKVVRLQSKKRELATAIDEGGAGDAAGWSMADLKSVITGD